MFEEASSIINKMLKTITMKTECCISCKSEYLSLPENKLCPDCENKLEIKKKLKTDTLVMQKKKYIVKAYLTENKYFSKIPIDKQKILIEKWFNLFPDIDILYQLQKMDMWLTSTGKKKKNYGAFITRWLIKKYENTTEYKMFNR